MVDNVAITAGTGTTIAADDVGGVLYQRVKVTWGPDATANDADVATGKPLPIQHRVSDGTAWTYGSGAIGAGTPRVALATDSPGVIATGTQGSPSSAYLSTVAAGDIAHDAVDSGNPQKQGGRAIAGLSGMTLVAAADRTDSLHGIDGVQYVRPHCGLEDIVSGVAAITDGSSTSVIASAGAGVKNYITSVMIANTSATAVTVDLRDGAAGTVKATLPVPANTSGVVCNYPIPLPFSAATAVCADPSAAASTVTVTLIGFKSKV